MCMQLTFPSALHPSPAHRQIFSSRNNQACSCFFLSSGSSAGGETLSFLSRSYKNTQLHVTESQPNFKQTVLWSKTRRNISSVLAQPGFLLEFRKVDICKGKEKNFVVRLRLRSKPIPGWAFSSGDTEVKDFSWDNTTCRRQSWADMVQLEPKLNKKSCPLQNLNPSPVFSSSSSTVFLFLLWTKITEPCFFPTHVPTSSCTAYWRSHFLCWITSIPWLEISWLYMKPVLSH